MTDDENEMLWANWMVTHHRKLQRQRTYYDWLKRIIEGYAAIKARYHPTLKRTYLNEARARRMMQRVWERSVQQQDMIREMTALWHSGENFLIAKIRVGVL